LVLSLSHDLHGLCPGFSLLTILFRRKPARFSYYKSRRAKIKLWAHFQHASQREFVLNVLVLNSEISRNDQDLGKDWLLSRRCRSRRSNVTNLSAPGLLRGEVLSNPDRFLAREAAGFDQLVCPEIIRILTPPWGRHSSRVAPE
jgi:hypothetical protein